MYDVIIIGGGPAGLNAALVLGRSRRKILIFDNNDQRNLKASQMHAYLSRDGITPNEFLRVGNEEILKYNVKKEAATVTGAVKSNGIFEVTDSSGEKYSSRKNFNLYWNKG